MGRGTCQCTSVARNSAPTSGRTSGLTRWAPSYKWSYGAPISRVITSVTHGFCAIYRAEITLYNDHFWAHLAVLFVNFANISSGSPKTKLCPLVGSGILDPWIILKTSHFVWSWTSRVSTNSGCFTAILDDTEGMFGEYLAILGTHILSNMKGLLLGYS